MGVISLAVRNVARGHVDLEAYLDGVTIRSVDDIYSAAEVLRDFAAQCDLRVALCADISDKKAMVDADGNALAETLFGWSNSRSRWWQKCCLGLDSPLALACRYEGEPFWTNADGFHGPFDNPYLAAIDLRKWYVNNAVGQSAIVVPVQLPFSQISANSFHPIDSSVDDLTETFEWVGGMLGAITRRFIIGYVAAIRKKRRIPAGCQLSKREVECLRWAAVGKTDLEIGMILHLSHGTVRYHVKRAGEKLESINRTQTIFKAGQLGFLGANS